MKNRLDKELVKRGLVITRSQAESLVKLGKVKLNGKEVLKAGAMVGTGDSLQLAQMDQYVSRAGLKLASVADKLELDFRDKVVLDVGSSTGGFTDYALQHGAKKVIAVDVGSDQLHPSLHNNEKIELHEKTDIRSLVSLSESPDIILIDVSFISLRDILPTVYKLATKHTQIVPMVKPQFEAGAKDINKGVVKNDAIRRQIFKNFEIWAKQKFLILNKADSEVAGAKGNRERFYLLKKI